MLSGERAFPGKSGPEVLSAILTGSPRSLVEHDRGLPKPLTGIVERCLEKGSEQRFHSPGDLAFAMRSLLGPGTATAAEAESSGRLRCQAVDSRQSIEARVEAQNAADAVARHHREVQRVSGRQLMPGQEVAALLIGVSPLDPLTYIGAAALMLLGATAAGLVAAARVRRVSPTEALHAA